MNPKGGFYAEYAAVKAEEVSLIPGKLTTQQAGAMPVDAMTALRGLDDTLGLKPGESVMIFGASGGIGHLAVQLAKRMGARVFAVASGSDGVALAKRLSADAVIDGHKDDIVAAARQFAPDGLDAALITAGGPAADEALAAMRSGGRVAYPNGVEPEPKTPSGISAKAYDGMPDPQAIEKLNRLVESEGLPPFEVHVARSFPLDQAAEDTSGTRRALPRQACSANGVATGTPDDERKVSSTKTRRSRYASTVTGQERSQDWMEYTKLGNTGMKVSRICLGCMGFGDAERWIHKWVLNEENSRPIIKKALEMGINFFDTANVYSIGTSEEILGRALKDFAKRDEVVIATKVHGKMREGPNGSRAVAQGDPERDRQQPEAAWDGLRGSLPDPSLGLRNPDRGDDGSAE